MLDRILEGGTVVDGTGAEPYTADVAVQGGRVVEVKRDGRITEAARERIDAAGAWVTPGFVDIHTHYDGQASWDETFSPSIHHGVTTVVMGNCGVGFAPLEAGGESTQVELMEGVEDIPGAALAEGVTFAWRSFPDYMAALDAMPHTIDFLAQVPHDPLRLAVMGERAAARESASPADVAAMRALLPDAALLDFATTGDLRSISLLIFDRSFAVTYYLQAVAIAIGLVGIAASLSAQVLARRKEFGLLTHLGFTRRQLLGLVTAEAAAWVAAGVVVGVLLGLAVSAVLVHVVNPQSFHWTMEMVLPAGRLLALCAAVFAAGTLTSAWSARGATARSAVLSVKEDW